MSRIPVDPDAIRQLAAILAETGLSEIEIADKDNRIRVGQTVAAGATLLLIEAMKTFNQIKAPSAGTVTRILVASGSPVEYGEALMVIEP
jgi:biotin carboxyl carrier protein